LIKSLNIAGPSNILYEAVNGLNCAVIPVYNTEPVGNGNAKPSGKEYLYLPYGLWVRTEFTSTSPEGSLLTIRELYDIQVAEPTLRCPNSGRYLIDISYYNNAYRGGVTLSFKRGLTAGGPKSSPSIFFRTISASLFPIASSDLPTPFPPSLSVFIRDGISFLKGRSKGYFRPMHVPL